MSTPRWQPLPPVRATDSVTALSLHQRGALAGTPAGLFGRRGSGAWERLDLAATEVQAIALGESPDVIAAGAGNAVDVSRDGGVTWERQEVGSAAARVTALAVNGSTLLAGTDRDGVFLSSNGGQSWEPSGLEGQMVLSVCGDRLAGTEEGLWRREGRSHWQRLKVEGVVTALAQSGDTLVAGTEEGGLLRSTDSGRTWRRCPGVEEGINALAAQGRVVVAGSSLGNVYRSADGGETWIELPRLPSAVMSVAVDGEHVLAGVYRGGLFEWSGGSWQAANAGLESTNAIDLLWSPSGLLLVAMDGLRRLGQGEWVPLGITAAGDIRAAAVEAGGTLLLGTTEGLFADDHKILDVTGITLVRSAPNGDIAALTEQALHMRLDGTWTEQARSERERTVDAVFSPSYPDDDGLLLMTLRQGTRASVVRFGPRSREVDRLFDYDAGSRWISVAMPPDYRVDTRRPAGFFAGTGRSLFRPAWPGDHWERDILHDPNALALSLALAPTAALEKERTVAVGTSAGAVITRNGGLLWMTMDDGLEDRRCLKMVYSPDGRLYCLTPTRVYELIDG